MKIVDIVKDWLEKHAADYDGLCCPGECACLTGDLMPCDQLDECEAGHRVNYEPGDCDCGNGCTWHIVAGRRP